MKDEDNADIKRYLITEHNRIHFPNGNDDESLVELTSYSLEEAKKQMIECITHSTSGETPSADVFKLYEIVPIKIKVERKIKKIPTHTIDIIIK